MFDQLMSCKSCLIIKRVYYLKIKNLISENRMSLLTTSSEFTFNTITNKINKMDSADIKCLSNTNNYINVMPFKVESGIKSSQAKKQGLKNEKILKEYFSFIDVTEVFIKLYSEKHNRYLPKGNSYVNNEILIRHQNKIKSLQEYKKMKIEEVISEEIYKELIYYF